uniref:Non-homologous end-joining factor 1 n=1 Tax=Oryzias sinensis TaxID=183150 RepID=A0A8C7WUA0_9TELE
RNAILSLIRPWIPICIDGCQFLAKSWFGEASYRVLLTDMRCVWEETMDAAATQSRAQELNRRLRASVTAFFSHLCEVAQPCLLGGNGEADRGAKITVTRLAADGLTMRLKSELAGLPFHWEFHCSPAPVSLVCVQLVRPLLGMSRLLQLQVDQLGRLLVRKDAEIQDYKENGATLSRGMRTPLMVQALLLEKMREVCNSHHRYNYEKQNEKKKSRYSDFVSHSRVIPMMKITGLSHLFKWDNLQNYWLTKYFLPYCI